MEDKQILIVSEQAADILEQSNCGMDDVVSVIRMLAIRVKELNIAIEIYEGSLKSSSQKQADLQQKVSSLEEQIQGLQSLLDLKQQEISVLESNIDSAIAELEDCGWYENSDKQQTMEVLYNLKEKQN